MFVWEVVMEKWLIERWVIEGKNEREVNIVKKGCL